MIRKFPGRDCVSPPGTIVNTTPPGCINYEKPFVQEVEEYEDELHATTFDSHQKALQDAYERGWWDGYGKCDDEHIEASKALDPSSEAAR